MRLTAEEFLNYVKNHEEWFITNDPLVGLSLLIRGENGEAVRLRGPSPLVVDPKTYDEFMAALSKLIDAEVPRNAETMIQVREADPSEIAEWDGHVV